MSRNCGAVTLASVTFQSPLGAVLVPVMRASASSEPLRPSVGSAMAAIDSGMARARAVTLRRSPTLPSTSSRPPPALMATPLISIWPPPSVIVAGPARARRWPSRWTVSAERSTRMRSPGVSMAALATVKPRALTETSSAVPAPAGRAFRLAEETNSLPTRKLSSVAIPSNAGRRRRSRPESFALNLSMLASCARMPAPLASIVVLCPPEALSKAMSALSAPPSFCSANAEKSSRSGAAKVSRPVAPPS